MKQTIYIITYILLFYLSSPVFAQSEFPNREFRGVWITTVNNLDWPSKPGLPIPKIKQELIEILDEIERLNFNAVIFQIRPTADAFYRSETEPWSAYLTGKQGKAPANNFDPLAYIIQQCHMRKIELHAWMNPFRISQNLTSQLSPKNVAMLHPDWVITYGNKKYLNPGIPEIQDYLTNVVHEVVENYQIDAIHFDDYFYPYPIAGTPFPDEDSYEKYGSGFSSVEEWRRNNVNQIIRNLNTTIKGVKPTVKFGISPFGVYKNYDEEDSDGSVTSAGNTNYDHLYADVIKWQQQGLIDYMIPQIYWEIGHPAVDYITLKNWWADHAYSHHVYIGHAIYKAIDSKKMAWQNAEEIPEQVRIARRSDNIQGSAFFRYHHLKQNPLGITDLLKSNLYQQPALLPLMPWLDLQSPQKPRNLRSSGLFKLKKVKWGAKNETDLLGFLIYASATKDSVNLNPNNRLFFTQEKQFTADRISTSFNKTTYFWVTAIDLHNNESDAIGPLKIKFQ